MEMRRRFCVAIALAALAAATPAQAAQRFASPTGDGSAETGEPCLETHPCTLARAVVNAPGAGHEVIVMPGTYNLSSGTQIPDPAAITIHGQAGQPRPTIVSSNGTLFTLETGSTISDLRIQTSGASATAVSLVNGATAERLEIDSSSSGTGAAALRTTSGATVRDSAIRMAATGANLVMAVSVGGDSSATTTIRNLTVVGTGTASRGLSGTAGAGSTQTVDAKNVVAQGGANDVVSFVAPGDTSTINIANSNFDTSEANSAGETINATDTQTDPPLFVDAGAGNFRPLENSPTVDAGGDDPSNGTTDADGNARVQGAAIDIGAYEFVPPQPPVPPGTPGTTTAPAVDTTKPNASIGALKLGSNGAVTTTLACPGSEVSCSFAYALASAKRVSTSRARILKLGKGSAAAVGGKSAKVSIKLSKRALRLIAAKGRLAVKLNVTTTDAAGNSATAAARRTLKPSKK